jgi:hypothetical protein
MEAGPTDALGAGTLAVGGASIGENGQVEHLALAPRTLEGCALLTTVRESGAGGWPMIAILILLACGSERWNVKTTTDADAAQIVTKAKTVTIAALTLRAPRPFADNAPRWPEEKQLLVIDAYLDGFKREDDGDYHVGIRDENGLTMVVEFPAPECLTGAVFQKQAVAARQALESILRVPITTSYKKLKTNTVRLRIVGPLFWDKIHGVRGVRAKNSVELHPVLGVKRLGG